jgi:pyridoxal phosphate enzyme (YggS family)
MPLDADIAANLDDLRRRLRAAASRTGRAESAVRLIAVSKTFGPEHVRAAMAAGQREFGENRVQEGLDKIAAVAGADLVWHLIGHLQTNKAKKAAAAFAWIHSIDSVELLRKVDAGAADAGTTPQVLVQVDLAQSPKRHGRGSVSYASCATAWSPTECHPGTSASFRWE